jgi:hypothetical protein
MSVQVTKNFRTKRLEVNFRQRKCVHLYHYQIHPIFGFMHARIQTWFPFTVYVCINGREWLARQMDQVGLHYRQRDNTFTWLEDIAQTQALFDQQLQANWFQLLGDLARTLNPVHEDMFAKYPARHFWSVIDSEWATDVMFRSRAAVQEIYPRLIPYAVKTFGSAEVLRFLGQPVPASGQVPHRWRHEVVTNLTERVEGIRLKHWLNGNSLKIYDKLSNLRVETTIREPGEFKVYRPAEGDPEGPEKLRPLRLGVADLHRRAQVCQAANERYLEALAAVHDTTPLRQQTDTLCQPGPNTRHDHARPTTAEASTAAGTSAQPPRPPGRTFAGGRQPSRIHPQWAAQSRPEAVALWRRPGGSCRAEKTLGAGDTSDTPLTGAPTHLQKNRDSPLSGQRTRAKSDNGCTRRQKRRY